MSTTDDEPKLSNTDESIIKDEEKEEDSVARSEIGEGPISEEKQSLSKAEGISKEESISKEEGDTGAKTESELEETDNESIDQGDDLLKEPFNDSEDIEDEKLTKGPSAYESSLVRPSAMKNSQAQSTIASRKTTKQSEFQPSEDDSIVDSPRESPRRTKKSFSGESSGSRQTSAIGSASKKSNLKPSSYQKTTINAKSLKSSLKNSMGSRISAVDFYDDEVEEDDFSNDEEENDGFFGDEIDDLEEIKKGEDNSSTSISDPGSGIDFDDDLMDSTKRRSSKTAGQNLVYLASLLIGPTLEDIIIHIIEFVLNKFGKNPNLSYQYPEKNIKKRKVYEESQNSKSQFSENSTKLSFGSKTGSPNGSAANEIRSFGTKRRTKSESQLFSEEENHGESFQSMSKKLSRSQNQNLSKLSRSISKVCFCSQERLESKLDTIRGSSEYRNRTLSRGFGHSNNSKFSKSESDLTRSSAESIEDNGKNSRASGDRGKTRVTFRESPRESGETFYEDDDNDEVN